MPMRYGVAVMVAVLASAAGATLPPMMCEGGDAVGTRNELGAYDFWPFQDGFVTYTASETATGAIVNVLEYCPDRRQLVVRTETLASDAVTDAAAVAMLEQMTFGNEGFTIDEMARRIGALGVPVEIRTVNYESCACANQ